jgi:prephenate dehydrogenase
VVVALGATPIYLTATRHDAAVAAISHLPLLAATELTLAAAESEVWADARSLAAGGFRDTTRVASGDPRMARDICLTNADRLIPLLESYIARLQRLRNQLQAADPGIEQAFRRAKSARDAWLDQKETPHQEK